VSALGGAATPDSTKALGRLTNDANAPAAVRAHAASQLAFAKGANAPDARDALAQAAADPSREVREASSLALGNVARELGDSDGESVRDLVARYEHAKDDEERTMLLEALGNSGSIEILPTVRGALTSENESIREAAAHALRFLPIGEADTVLSRVLGSEPSTTVIVAAIDSIGFRIVEMHARALERVVVADTAGRVRSAVAEVARRALDSRKATLSTEARAVLTSLLEKTRA
jgi:HEAT repeat protein